MSTPPRSPQNANDVSDDKIERFLIEANLFGRNRQAFKQVLLYFPGLSFQRFAKLVIRAECTVKSQNKREESGRPKIKPRTSVDDDDSDYLDVDGSDLSEDDQTYAQVVARNPYRIRNFIIRNHLYLDRNDRTIERIRRHYHINEFDRGMIYAAIQNAQQYIRARGKPPRPPGCQRKKKRTNE